MLYMSYLFIRPSISMLLFLCFIGICNKERTIYYLLYIYTFLQTMYTQCKSFINKGLHFQKIYFYHSSDNSVNVIEKYSEFQLLLLFNNISEDDVIFVYYTIDCEPYIDIITKDIVDTFDQVKMRNYSPIMMEKTNISYKRMIVSSSITVKNEDGDFIYNEEDITIVMKQILHNVINHKLSLAIIKKIIFHHLNIEENECHTFTLCIVNDDCEILNEEDIEKSLFIDEETNKLVIG